MTSGSITAYVAAALSSVLAVSVILRRRSMPAWFFAAGMVLLAVESCLGGLSLSETDPGKLARWHAGVLITKSLIPSIWLAFSLTYLRGDYRRHLRRWRGVLVAALIIPVGLAAGFRDSLVHVRPLGGGWWIDYSSVAAVLNLVVLLSTIIILTNLEKTLLAAAGTARWKIKFAMLGLGVIFGARIYTRSQSLLFSGFDLNLTIVETSALLVGCVLMTISLVRQGFGAIDIYPSRAFLQSSVTLLLTGGYLFVVGVLAQLAAALGGAGSFQFQTVVVLAGVAVLAVLLFSDRLRQQLRAFVGRHFRRPQHDSLTLWRSFTHQLSSMTDPRAYCARAVKLTAESFQVLSVTVWLHDERKDCLSPVASTVARVDETAEPQSGLTPAAPILEGLLNCRKPFDMDRDGPDWAGSLRTASQPYFRKGGGRLCLPLVAADRALGAMILTDRVNGVSYTTEEYDLLQCIGDQIAAGLVQFQLTEELMQGREMEAFQTMSTFFVHDLKNAASGLGLMLENLPVHFADPAFRQDALRGIGSTVTRINQIISRLGSLRQKLECKPVATDLNQLVASTLDGMTQQPGIELVREFQTVPPVLADKEQIESVITNLLINAREAMEQGGKITVRTARHDDRALVSVADTGCGMSPSFIRDSLFRPFSTTKKKGLGIGMFQCRMIVQAHRGSIQVESEPGRGSTFQITLPLKPEAA